MVAMATASFVDEELSERRILVESVTEISELFEEVVISLSSRLKQSSFLGLDFFSGFVRECHSAPDARGFFARCLTLTARTFDWRGWVGFFGLDIDPVRASNFAVVRLAKYADVARCNVAPTLPAVVILDVSLVDVLTRQVRRRGLSHPSVGNIRMVNPRTAGGFLNHLQEHPIGDSIDRVEFRPQRRCRRAVRRMNREPLTEIRDARDDERGSLATLAINRDLDSVSMIRDIANAEVLELLGACADIPRDSDGRFVAVIRRVLEHRLDMVVPEEHLCRVGHRLIVAGRSRREFADSVRFPVARCDVFGKHPDGNAVVAFGLLAGEIPFNPASDRLQFFTVVNRVHKSCIREFVGVVLVGRGASEDGTVLQKLHVTDIGIIHIMKFHLIGESEQRRSVIIVDMVAGLDAITQRVDLAVAIGHTLRYIRRHVNVWCSAGRRHASLSSHAPSYTDSQVAARPSGGVPA